MMITAFHHRFHAQDRDPSVLIDLINGDSIDLNYSRRLLNLSLWISLASCLVHLHNDMMNLIERGLSLFLWHILSLKMNMVLHISDCGAECLHR
jgi:hypothetical protein